MLAHRLRLGPLIRADLERCAVQMRTTAAALGALDQEVKRLVADIEHLYGPFEASMTVDQAWRRHPLARQVFARHHLPGCDQCAVRFDETVGEAAEAYGLDLEKMLVELNALLGPV